MQWTTKELQDTGNKSENILTENLGKFRIAVWDMVAEELEKDPTKAVQVQYSVEQPNVVQIESGGEILGCYYSTKERFLCPLRGMYSLMFEPDIKYKEGAVFTDFE